MRVVRVAIWVVRASIWSSSIRASSPWWSSKRPVSASIRAPCLAFIRPARQPGKPPRVALPGDQRPSMSRTDMVSRVDATADTLISASSSSFSSRCQ